MKNEEYRVLYSSSSYSLEFTTERYYHPLMGVQFVAEGKTFVLFMLEKVLDPEGRLHAIAERQATVEKYERENPSKSEAIQMEMWLAIAISIVDEALDFVDRFRKELVPMNESVSRRYNEVTLEAQRASARGGSVFG